MEAKNKNIRVARIILKTVGVAGLLSVALLAPNAMQILEMFNPGAKKNRRRGYYFVSVVRRLRERGLIKFVKNKHGIRCLALTKNGELALVKNNLVENPIRKPKKWDRKFRLVIFDIKEYKRIIRENLRKQLVHLGFIKLQKSVWVYPYECQEIILLLKAQFRIGREILYITADSIENSGWLEKEFDLK